MMSCGTQQDRTNGSEAGSDQIHSWRRRGKKVGNERSSSTGSGEEEEEKGCDDEDGSASEGMKASPGLPGLGVADPDQRCLSAGLRFQPPVDADAFSFSSIHFHGPGMDPQPGSGFRFSPLPTEPNGLNWMRIPGPAQAVVVCPDHNNHSVFHSFLPLVGFIRAWR